jgi:kelch-like protein 10
MEAKCFGVQTHQNFKELMSRFVCFCRRFFFCTGLESDARRFVMHHFVQVSQQSEELLELPVEELQAIVGSDELNVKHEEVVWECVLRWIDHDAENRKGHIVDLMKNVRLGLLDAQFFFEKVSTLPVFRRVLY